MTGLACGCGSPFWVTAPATSARPTTGRGRLTFVKKSCEHGVFLGTPPLRIDHKRTYHLHWNNPFVGSTKASCYLSPDDGTITLSSQAGASSGGQAAFTYLAARK